MDFIRRAGEAAGGLGKCLNLMVASSPGVGVLVLELRGAAWLFSSQLLYILAFSTSA
eukprot:CAMPEP_0114284564 /NCGR_PEP_ID=MMETSP0059-20121206/4717_1 /TAXON_ID=36894 /ORGANISM="Pyramimonas parkeae, Strain CCMP726" /LENGTH=56 /DNA_ID=CAMNT_0001405397 /DNA_START=628 /DNA_END=798 /DNA_ORIENTATION=-